MPRRTTKCVPTQEVMMDLNSEDEKRFEDLPLILRDLEKETKNTLQEWDDMAESAMKAIRARCAMGLSKIPSAIRNMPFESLVNVIAPAKRPKPAEPEIDNRLKNIKSTVKQSTRKRKAANSAAVPSSATRSSSRSRTVEETPLASRTQHAKNNLFTPANNQTGGANFGMTPLITPKWNPMTPLARTAHRQARPNETTVSLNGSPVMGTMSKPRGRKRAKAADDGGEGFMTMPLGDDLVLNLPLGDAPVDTDSLDLDDDQLAKVAQANKMLVAMLKARGMSTDESD